MKKRYTVVIAAIVGLIYGAFDAEHRAKDCWNRKDLDRQTVLERCAVANTAAGQVGGASVFGVLGLAGGLLLSPLLVTRRNRQNAELKRLRREVDAKERDDEIKSLQERLDERIEPTLTVPEQTSTSTPGSGISRSMRRRHS